MPRFSIIVPFLGDAIEFDNTLASVLRNRNLGTDVIVPHDGTYNDVHQLADEVAFVETEKGAPLVRLFNSGLRSSQSEFVGLVRPGVQLPANWDHPIADAFQTDRNVASVAPLLVDPKAPKRLVAAGIQLGAGMNRKLSGPDTRIAPRKLRSVKPLGPTSWAAFYRRSALEQFGTPDECLDSLYLDLDIALGLGTLGHRCQFASDCVVSINNPEELVEEALEPHGVAAQRAFRRHPQQARKFSFWTTALKELIRSPFQPSLFRHLMKRSASKQFADIDDSFARRIDEKKSLGHVDVDQLETEFKRAA